MVAGFNIRVRVWRMTEFSDDVYGGAQVTGTILYESLDARLQALKPHPLLLQQSGLEVTSLFRCMVRTTGLGQFIRPQEYDEVEVIWPPQHAHYESRFRIMKIQEDGLHPLDRRGIIELTLSRVDYSRTQQG